MSESILYEGFLVRDKRGALWFFSSIPEKVEDQWVPTGSMERSLLLHQEMFPEIKWEDDPVPTSVTFDLAI